MKLALSPVSICRSPIFSIQEELKNVWDDLKQYIQESSPEFYAVIKDLDYTTLPQTDIKLQFTIWKYFNRARFRATPYGNFAAFSLVPISREAQSGPIVLEKNPVIHRFPNWKQEENINPDPKWLLAHASFIRANTTAYACGNELRYMSIADGSFELSSTIVESTITDTLNYCHNPRTITEVQFFLQDQLKLSKPIAHYFLQQLLHFQLLITDFHPNIIGPDYFKRINYKPAAQNDDYIIAERKAKSGALSAKHLQVLLEVSNFLSQHLSPVKNTALQDFKKGFNKKYDGKKIPLLIAMDPELGIGYRSLTQAKEQNELVHELNGHRDQLQPDIKNLPYPPIYQFILDGMIANQSVDLSQFKASGHLHPLPLANTLSILLHPSDELLVVSQIGGCTANSLLGRFTMASDDLVHVGKQFSELEHCANPDVLFFDIAYQIEKHADNINRRQAIYPYELPILSWSESGDILDPDDIMLSLRGDELILTSVKYGKRIVPKLASAYNYSRSDLSLYRFLSDLQYQNINPSLAINILDIFPGLSHYQRIHYKNVVLSTEKWLVPQEICKAMHSEVAQLALSEWLVKTGLSKPFKAGVADQTLIFDPQSEQDKQFFLLFCKNKTQLYIEEAFIPVTPSVSDEQAKAYLTEFVVNLQHEEKLYTSITLQSTPIKNGADFRDSFLPGSEWVYFEIYCHPTKSDELLLYIENNYLSVYKKQIKKWFFIRYNDPSNHIRLRLNLSATADLGLLISGLSALLSAYVSNGIVSDFQIKTYRRENDRYGAQNIYLAEQYFSTDSRFVLSLISKPQPIHFYYNLSITLLEHVFKGMPMSLQQQLEFAELMANSYAKEMNITPEGFKKINIGYKEFMTDSILMTLNQGQYRKLLPVAKSFLKVINTNTETETRSLLADLFHMHINRLFNEDQRMHELIIYHYLTKKTKMMAARSRQMP